MGASFLRFKRKAFVIRLIKSLLLGFGAGTLCAGALLVLGKLEVIPLLPVAATGAGCGGFILFGAIAFLLLRVGDAEIARRLDNRLNLSEKLQTMVAFADKETPMVIAQREDAEAVLAGVRTRDFRAKGIIASALVFAIGITTLTAGLVMEDRRNIEPPVEIIPFKISEMQIAGINELISYVNSSKMEEEYKQSIASELESLLQELKLATTEPEMQAALADSMTGITITTYDSSSMTEILNAMWSTDDKTVRALVRLLDTSYWQNPDWGDFAEKLEEFKDAMAASADIAEDERISDIKWKLETINIKTVNSLNASGIKSDDILFALLLKLVGDGDGEVRGFGGIRGIADDLSYEDAMLFVFATLDAMSNEIYGVMETQKVNTNTGEYVLTKLSVLFNVLAPKFERPALNENPSQGDDNSDENENVGGGGVGEGAVFGSNDLVLDPMTGKYVEYGTLYAKYNAWMIEKLASADSGYTDEQKKAIEKYFALLYSGLEEDED